MSEAIFARAWVLVLGGAAACLTVASWARADLFALSTGAESSPSAITANAEPPLPSLDEAGAEPAIVYGAPSEVPSDLVVNGEGSGAAPQEPTLVAAAADLAAPSAPAVEAVIEQGATPIVVPPTAAPVESPQPAIRTATDDAPCKFTFVNSRLTRAIVEQRAAPGTSPFEADGRPLYLWIESNNIDGRGQTAIFRWVHEPTDTVFSTSLDLAISARWRTWTEISLPPTLFGPWRVEVIDSEGCQVDLVRFEMLPRGW